MTTIRIELRDEIVERLEQEAKRLNTTIEQLASERAERLLSPSKQEISQLIEDIVCENRELYQRLAQ